MRKYIYSKLGSDELVKLTKRPAINMEKTMSIVRDIINKVKAEDDNALRNFTLQFDKFELKEIAIKTNGYDLSQEKQFTIDAAARNIRKFHSAQMKKEDKVEVMDGVICFRENRAIEKVGLYVPGGSAPLISTVLMLAIPAQIAGCKEVVLCSPPPIAEEIKYAAYICGIEKIYQIGGAQAIAAMAYGTKSIPKVYKIFGPGNQYVTAAKMAICMEGVAIDMPAGPSEVLVIADECARADFVAADLLSQAEHGADSQAILLCKSLEFAEEIDKEIARQMQFLSRAETAKKALDNSYSLICENVDQMFNFSNQYAPEHLILNLENADKYLQQISNAGSVFIGPFSCESAGDYASGTNHTLPTYGFAKAYSGVSCDSFIKKITFQKINEQGVMEIGTVVEQLAEHEGLDAHKYAMSVRIDAVKRDLKKGFE